MEPALNKTQNLAFEITSCSNNWLALGVCHQKKIKDKGFTFDYSTVGHGAYLVSSNGGSWSSSQVSHNNVIKTFKFKAGVTVYVEYNPEAKKINFKKKTGEKYSLDFEPISDDPLHFCVLFFYKNDEVKYLGKSVDFGFNELPADL
jgi:hypothetical protein